MPTIVPSQVVEDIGRAYPGLDEATTIGWEHSGVVAGILDLLNSVPEQHYALLSSADYSSLRRAAATLREMLERWRYVDEKSLKLTGGPKLRRSEAFGKRHPLQVIREVLGKCPDEAPSESKSDLAFIGDPEFAGDLRQDITTATSTLSNGEFKAACVMAGSVIEALLLWAVKRKTPAERGTAIAACQQNGEGVPANPDPDRWDLAHLLNVSRRLPVISEETFGAADPARGYRNLIHPGKALRLQVKPTKARATLAVGGMLQVIDDLGARVAANTL